MWFYKVLFVQYIPRTLYKGMDKQKPEYLGEDASGNITRLTICFVLICNRVRSTSLYPYCHATCAKYAAYNKK